jgi:hypothetical protein
MNSESRKRYEEATDLRKPGEAFCADCPDHEGCMTGYPCGLVKSVSSHESLEARLMALHRPVPAGWPEDQWADCAECKAVYPCPTIALLSDPGPASVGAEGACLPWLDELEGPASETMTVGALNRLLNVNLWEVRSFRADVRIDFDEYGTVIATWLLNSTPPTVASDEAVEKHACTECPDVFPDWESLYTHQVRGHGWGKEDN